MHAVNDAPKVVGIHGAVPAGEPVPHIVARLERLLEDARSGELRALACACAYRDGHITTGWEKPEAAGEAAISFENHALGSAILTLSVRYGRAGAPENED